MRFRAAALAALAALAPAGCTSGGGRVGPSSPSVPSSSAAPSSANPRSAARSHSTAKSGVRRSAPARSPTGRALAAMSLAERVGQLLMVDCPTAGLSDVTSTAVERYHVGSVILDGTSYAGTTRIRALTTRLQSLAPGRVGLFVATDQEGGQVQRLNGSGFSTIPSGTDQGRSLPAALQSDARRWGAQLRSAGVNFNLAPVLDTVPAGFGSNPPIGDLDREYGHTPGNVTTHGLAFARGMAAAGVDVAVKHFPGLGRVSGNTDQIEGVADTVTTTDDPYLAPFAAAIQAGVPFVMISTASYSRLDPGTPAAFSARIVTGLLRQRLGFHGVVVSDDVGVAEQVARYSPGERAVRFIDAGGDLVLTVVAGQAAEMATALLHRARTDAAFRRHVDAAVLRVLQAKRARGLLA